MSIDTPVNVNVGALRKSVWKIPAFIATLAVLILFAASRLVRDWHWHPGAFVVVGAIIFTMGLIYQLITRNRAMSYSAGVGVAFVAAFGLMWGNLVQMADVNPDARMYFAVPLVGIIGAAIARLRPNGMARALFVTALAQVCVLIIVFSRDSQISSWSPPEVRGFAGNIISLILFAASAWLFRRAARTAAPEIHRVQQEVTEETKRDHGSSGDSPSHNHVLTEDREGREGWKEEAERARAEHGDSGAACGAVLVRDRTRG